MSRSYRKTPVTGTTTAPSEKWDKQKANRRFRRKVRVSTRHNRIIPLIREISNVWSFDKDGKQRFNPRQWAKLMRK